MVKSVGPRSYCPVLHSKRRVRCASFAPLEGFFAFWLRSWATALGEGPGLDTDEPTLLCPVWEEVRSLLFLARPVGCTGVWEVVEVAVFGAD